MANNLQLNPAERTALMSELVQWKAVVEQVVMLLDARKDPQAAQITVWLMIWLSEPKNVKRTLQMTLEQIIGLAKSMLVKPGAAA